MSTGKTVVVTGASTGIGRACALHLDRLGWRVFAGVRREVDGRDLQEHATGPLTPLLFDVTDVGQVTAAAAEVRTAVGEAGLDGLVNNAGIVVPGPLEFLPLEEFRRQLEVNVTGQVAVTQAFLSLIRAAQGRIVNIGSSNGYLSIPLLAPYCVSKFAMEAISDALRMELRPWGIHVALVEPGSIDTPIWERTQRFGEDLRARMPAEAETLYGAAVDALEKGAQKSAAAAIPPEAVARAVGHALTARRPRTRYPVGKDAKAVKLLVRVLPDRARDWVVLRVMRV